jgi:hypothetical protein
VVLAGAVKGFQIGLCGSTDIDRRDVFHGRSVAQVTSGRTTTR